MAIIFDMSSGKIQRGTAAVSRVTDSPDFPEIGPALQEVCDIPETVTHDESPRQHIMELLKQL